MAAFSSELLHLERCTVIKHVDTLDLGRLIWVWLKQALTAGGMLVTIFRPRAGRSCHSTHGRDARDNLSTTAGRSCHSTHGRDARATQSTGGTPVPLNPRAGRPCHSCHSSARNEFRLAGCFSFARKVLNPTCDSWWIVQVRPTKRG